MDNKWSDRLRRRMEAHAEPPPEGLWDSIERAMDRQGKPSAVTSPKKRSMLLWGMRIGAAAAVVAFFVLIGNRRLVNDPASDPLRSTVGDLSGGPSSEPAGQESIGQESVGQVPAGAREAGADAARGEVGIAFLPERERERAAEAGTEPGRKPEPEPEPRKEPETVMAEKQPAKPEKSESPTENPAGRPVERPAEMPRGTFELAADNRTHIPKPKSKKWRTGLYASNVLPGSANKNSRREYDMVASSAGDPVYSNSLVDHDASSIIEIKNFREEEYTDVKHTPPVAIGASVSYGLNERWSLTSGVTYTLLSSRFRAGGYLDYRSAEQVLHYIGIPLNINYNIWRGERLSVYLSGGGFVEKNVSATLATQATRHVMGGDEVELKDKKTIPLDRLQWSINGSVGVQYDFVKRVGLYFEPGVNYYFNNNSSLETVYKAKPVNFGLRLGLRFSL